VVGGNVLVLRFGKWTPAHRAERRILVCLPYRNGTIRRATTDALSCES
jgi:hypothetical protein